MVQSVREGLWRSVVGKCCVFSLCFLSVCFPSVCFLSVLFFVSVFCVCVFCVCVFSLCVFCLCVFCLCFLSVFSLWTEALEGAKATTEMAGGVGAAVLGEKLKSLLIPVR